MTDVSRRDPSPEQFDSMLRHLHRKLGLRMLRRLLIYHALLAALLLVAAMLVPGFTDYLPVGGVKDLVSAGAAAAGSPPQSVVQGDGASLSVFEAGSAFDRLGYARQLILVLAGTWLLMLPISWVHKAIHRASTHDHSLDETVLILPGTVAAIVLVVQHSLALAFSLAGIVAGVQFRRALQDTFDALFILVAIGVGIAAGVRALEIAAVLTAFFCYATLYVYYFGDGFESDFIALKKMRKKMRKDAVKVEGDAGDHDDAAG